MKPLASTSLPTVNTRLSRTTLTLALVVGGWISVSNARIVGSGHLATETRNVSGFHAVSLESSGDVVITQGDTEGLTVEAEDNILPLIVTEVDGKGVLHLGLKPHESIQTTRKTTFKLSAKLINSLTIEGSGDVHADSLSLQGNGKFAVSLPGSGNISVGKLTAGSVEASLEGSGDIKLAGDADSQTVSIDGSGKYETADLHTRAAQVNINGSGDAKLSASAELKIEINGSGDVGYYGRPDVKQSINGSGDVKALGERGR